MNKYTEAKVKYLVIPDRFFKIFKYLDRVDFLLDLSAFIHEEYYYTRDNKTLK